MPVLLSREPAPVDAAGAARRRAGRQTAKADDALAEPVVAKASAEDRTRRRRVLGVRKDPFKPAAAKEEAKAVKKAKKVEKTTTPYGDRAGADQLAVHSRLRSTSAPDHARRAGAEEEGVRRTP